jgi:hypothetical protein
LAKSVACLHSDGCVDALAIAAGTRTEASAATPRRELFSRSFSAFLSSFAVPTNQTNRKEAHYSERCGEEEMRHTVAEELDKPSGDPRDQKPTGKEERHRNRRSQRVLTRDTADRRGQLVHQSPEHRPTPGLESLAEAASAAVNRRALRGERRWLTSFPSAHDFSGTYDYSSSSCTNPRSRRPLWLGNFDNLLW